MNSKVNSNIWTAYRLFYIFYIVKLNYIYFVLIYIFSFVFHVLWKFVFSLYFFCFIGWEERRRRSWELVTGMNNFRKKSSKKKIFPELFIPFLDLNTDLKIMFICFALYCLGSGSAYILKLPGSGSACICKYSFLDPDPHASM